ncbi:sugar porter family MFS transporter [Streptomyces olivaceiscleroticus]|uniref:Sugar porter family MFS transporter n=1 Tax=Streptomyces olivaceiscleroticus TaxID=68245 RepID=A0ABN0ZWR9_9ACTN
MAPTDTVLPPEPGAPPRTRGRAAVLGASAVAALGGFLFGYDTGIISSALLHITPEFHLSAGMQQVTVASLLLGAIVGVLVSGAVTDAVGRRRTLLAAAGIFTVGALGCAAAPDDAVLIAARFVLGLAIGTASLAVPAYIAEIAPKESRGKLVSLNQLMITVGIFVSYLVGYAFDDAAQGWRWMLGLGAAPSLLMMVGVLRLSESPRWLLTHGRPDEARTVLCRTRTAEEAEREIREIETLAAQESKIGYRDLLRPAMRPAVVLGVVVAATNQLVGVNAVIYYAPTMLQQAGFASSAAILSSLGIGLVNMVLTGIALLLVDKVGRRPLLLGGTAVVVLALVLLGALYLVGDGQPAHSGLLVAGLCLYIGAFAPSLGLAIWLINSEIFPTAARGKASSFGNVTHWGLDFAISLTVLTTIQALTPTGLFWLYAAFGLLGVGYLYRKLPETKGRSLEDISASLRGEGRSAGV